MVSVKDIYKYMDQIAPFALQMGFDNAGFLVGRGAQKVERLMVSLDITEDVVAEAVKKNCQLIVAHHPVIFQPAKAITDDTVTGRVLLALTENRIAAICAHTNLDAVRAGVNDCLAAALELRDVEQLSQDGLDPEGNPYGIGRVGVAHKPGLSASEYAAFVKEKLGTASVRFVDAGKPIKKVAVGGGSCGSMVAEALALGCDAFVTADVKHDQYLSAKAQGLALMDAGHFATENVVCAPLALRLAQQFPAVEALLSESYREAYSGL